MKTRKLSDVLPSLLRKTYSVALNGGEQAMIPKETFPHNGLIKITSSYDGEEILMFIGVGAPSNSLSILAVSGNITVDTNPESNASISIWKTGRLNDLIIHNRRSVRSNYVFFISNIKWL